MIAQTQTTSNTRASQAASKNTNTHERKRPWYKLVYELKKQHKLNANHVAILKEMINLSSLDAKGTYGRERIAKNIGVSVSTVYRAYKKFRGLSLIQSIERHCWDPSVPNSEKTNITTLLFVEHKLPPVEVKMTYDINNLNYNLRDNINIIDHNDFRCSQNDLNEALAKHDALIAEHESAKRAEARQGGGEYMFPKVHAREITLPYDIHDKVTASIDNTIHAEQILLTLTLLKCPIAMKRLLLCDLLEFKRTQPIRNPGAVLMTSFKYRLKLEGDQLNTKNKHLQPADVTATENIPAIYQTKDEEQPLDVEVQAKCIEMARKYYEQRNIPIETMFDQIGLNGETHADLIFYKFQMLARKMNINAAQLEKLNVNLLIN